MPATTTATAQTTHNTITVSDGTQIYYKDWGQGQPIVFSHGWPLSADAWEDQMVFLAFAVIAASRTIAAATVARVSRGTATKWTPTRTISPRSSKRSICRTRFTSATQPAAAKSPATSAATERSASRRRC